MPTFYAGQQDYIVQLNNLWDRGTASLYGTSTTSNSISVGTKTFITQANLQFYVGSRINVTNTADLSKYMSGQVTAYDGASGSLTVDIITVNGSGTFATWSLTLSGAAGATGVADNISIGTVTQGTAAASITGTSPNKFLNLTLQKGDAGLTWKGAWVSGSSYSVSDAVSNGGSSYFRTVAGAGTLPPSSDPTNWSVLAEKGADVSTLAAVSKTLHIGTVVAATIYDTSKDSDGGAWRKRCQNTSWYNESINGAWLGQAATAAAAWALSGAATGAYFQNSTDGKFYTLGASSPTVAETFRGNTREFPAVVEIIAETNRVVIYDAANADRPMWMVFVYAAGYYSTGNYLINASGLSGVAAVNGVLAISDANATDGRLLCVRFISDNASSQQFANSFSGLMNGNISMRNSNKGFTANSLVYWPIVNKIVNGVAMTVLDSTPIDAATGLPKPTIAVATQGGVSVVKDDGTVVNSLSTNSFTTPSISGDYLWVNGAGNNYLSFAKIFGIGANFAFTSISTPFTAWPYGGTNNTALSSSIDKSVMGSTAGVVFLKNNPATPSKGMVDYITSAYNSGWMVGDIRGAWLADTTAETISTPPELIINGTFATDTSGWSPLNSTLSVVAGKMRVATTASDGRATQLINTVVGKTYRVEVDASGGTSSLGVAVSAGNNQGGSSYLATTPLSTSAKLVFNFTATQTTSTIIFSVLGVSGNTGDFDNVSVKLVEADRSVKNNGLTTTGTLTKAAVASGANLVAYSGFSSSNYLEQPYNSQLDFGTGDFCVMGWVNVTSTASTQCLFSRGTLGAGFLSLYFLSGTWRIVCSATAVVTSTAVAVNTGLQHITLSRVSGNIYLHINGVQVYTAANTANITNTSAKLVIGAYFDYTLAASNCSLALWRLSATAPSADQIAYVYDTERKLFEPNAQCTLAGTSNTVTSLAYDDSTDILHVGTDWGRSSFQRLTRIDSAVTTVGTGMKLAASEGSILTCGTNAFVYQPAYFLREELKRKKEAREALGKIPVFFDSDATASQTTFLVPKGYTVKAVYSAGTLKRIGSTKDYTIASDGFVESVVFGTGLSAATWVSIMCVRV